MDDFQLIHREEAKLNVAHVDLIPKGHGRNEIAFDLMVRKTKTPESGASSVLGAASPAGGNSTSRALARFSTTSAMNSPAVQPSRASLHAT